MAEYLKLKHSQMLSKTVGVLGGMGAAEATIAFEQTFHTISRQYIPQKFSTGFPPLITAYFRDVPLKINDEGVIENPLRPSDKLLLLAEQIGGLCDFLVITSNTPHFFLEDIEKAAGNEVLSMVEVTVNEIKRKKFKRVGLMAVGLTLENKLYQHPLENLGIEYEILPNTLSNDLDTSIFQVMEGSISLESKLVAAKAIKYLADKKVDAIILGCTEIPLLLLGQEYTDILIDPVALLATAAVKKSLGLL